MFGAHRIFPKKKNNKNTKKRKRSHVEESINLGREKSMVSSDRGDRRFDGEGGAEEVRSGSGSGVLCPRDRLDQPRVCQKNWANSGSDDATRRQRRRWRRGSVRRPSAASCTSTQQSRRTRIHFRRSKQPAMQPPVHPSTHPSGRPSIRRLDFGTDPRQGGGRRRNQTRR